MSRKYLVLALAGAALSLGCGSSYGDAGGEEEPITLAGNPTFIRGDMPNDNGPALLQATSMSTIAYAGGPDKSLSGFATEKADGIAVRLKGYGKGYWVVPVGLPDFVDPGLTWGLKFRFMRSAPLGLQKLLVAESDVNGKFGVPTEIPYTVKSMIPDGKKVISLIWSNHADLDLQVQGPDGKLTSGKHPNTGTVPKNHMIPTGGLPGDGVLDRDSNANCVFDGFMEEDVVFNDDPTPGLYQIWVDEYSNCGEPATTFQVQLTEDGVETFSTSGQLLDINADAGVGAGLFIHEFTF